MQLRRPLAVLLTGLAIVFGGALTGCAGPAEHTGTPMDNAVNTHGNDPTGDAQGNLPLLGGKPTEGRSGRVGGNAVGVP